jgi:hypothetical protein
VSTDSFRVQKPFNHSASKRAASNALVATLRRDKDAAFVARQAGELPHLVGGFVFEFFDSDLLL